MEENNQYGQAMTKPLPYGCIKKMDEVPTVTELNKILDSISHDDKTGHLFTVDIKFHNINKKHYYLMKFICQYLKKNKKIDPFERSTLQLMSVMVRDEEKDKINTFAYNSKTHSTLKEKKFISLHAEDLHFLITKAGWLVPIFMPTAPLNSQNLKKISLL